MQMSVSELVKERASQIQALSGEMVHVLYEQEARQAADISGASLGEVFRAALRQGIIPYRYIRNQGIISVGDQLRLAESKVAVVGAGGLGGQVIILLARTGIGSIVVIDADKFDETNLNRQALSSTSNVGQPKALQALEKVKEINPGVEVTPHVIKLSGENAKELLEGVNVVVDALDNVPDRFILEDACKRIGIPMVHAGIAGFEGQLMSIYPQDPGLSLVYGEPRRWKDATKTPEALLGVPAVTASLLATLQTMEVLKILLGKGEPLRKCLLRPDLEAGEFHKIMFA